MQKKNLQERYRAADPVEVPLRRMFKRMCSLSLIPASEVAEMYTSIVQHAMEHYYADADISSYFHYFETTWMGEISSWNHYGDFGPRTNNHLEAFHSTLKRDLNNNAHPHLYPFIDLIRKKQKQYEMKLADMVNGARSEPLKKKYVMANRRYRNAVTAYENSPFPDRLFYLMEAVQSLLPEFLIDSHAVESESVAAALPE